MELRTANHQTFGINYKWDVPVNVTWLTLIEQATLDLGLAHPDELDHVHCVLAHYEGEWVSFKDEHGNTVAGHVVNIRPAGYRANGVGINTPNGFGCYIRPDGEASRCLDHARINWEERTIDFDSTHRFLFDSVIPADYESVSLDTEHE